MSLPGMSASVAELLAEARSAGLDRLDAQVLLAHHLSRPRAWVVANDDAPIVPVTLQKLRADIVRRAAGAPLAYLTGQREFHSLRLRVTPDVLVPRPETEVLVGWALELLGGVLAAVEAPAVIDLGTGSGAVALAVRAHCPRARVLATDASATALAVAQQNSAALGLALGFGVGNWWGAAAGACFHLALSNPPYLAAGDPHLAALTHEPMSALTAGSDGLDAIRVIVAGAASHLEVDGWLLLEHGHDQRQAVADLLEQQGFSNIACRRDLAGLPRCSGGRCSD